MTPLSPLPFVGFSLTLLDNLTVVEADPQPFSNTKEVIFLNGSPDDRIFVRVADLSAGLPIAGDVTAANSSIIPAGGSLSLCIGPEGERNALGTVAFWAIPTPGSKLGIVFKAESGADVELNVTYVQCLGGGTGR